MSLKADAIGKNCDKMVNQDMEIIENIFDYEIRDEVIKTEMKDMLKNEPKMSLIKTEMKDMAKNDHKISLIKETNHFREYLLPFGWKKTGKRRQSSNKWDYYLISPNGSKFRSTVQLNKYLDANPDVKCDRDVTDAQEPTEIQLSMKMKTGT